MATKESGEISKNLSREACGENSSSLDLIDVLSSYLQDIDQNENSLHLKKRWENCGNEIMGTNNRSSTYSWFEFEGQLYDM